MDNIIYIINKIRHVNMKINIYIILIFLLLFSITVNFGQAVSTQVYDHSSGNRECYTCHNSTHARAFQPKIDSQNTNPVKTGSQITSVNSLPVTQTNMQAATHVLGNITLITSMGQDWYQQGIYGPSADNSVMDGSWGWTFFDENPQSGFIIPNESVTQRNNIYALLLDDGNNSNPISGAQVMANVTYWTYNGTNYISNNQSIQLIEDINHRGFYSGRFDFYGGTPYSGYGMDWCDGCHKTDFYGGQDINLGYFPGNYTVLIKAESGNKIINEDSNFEVTPWGCEDCHGSGNQHRSSQPDRHIVSADMDSACYTCHSMTEVVGMYNAGNPHQNTAHININCIDCHTNKGLNSSFSGVTFSNGGINNAPIPQYNYNIIELNKGTHSSLSCTDCHKDLILPNPQGGYKSDSYTINDTINRYDPNFANIKKFQDYYVINVTGEGPVNISFDWDETANLGFYLYPPNFNPRNFTNLPYFQGSTFTNKPEIYGNTTPVAGLWTLQTYGYNLNGSGDIWVGELQLPINYTINSTYPIQRKDMPSTPECNSCHNSTASGKAFTTDAIPAWNPGFAHVDTNNDGTPDIQCKMCHNAMHDIVIKNCQDCHTTAPTSHPVREPTFSQYAPSQCLACHGDPHEVTSAGGTDCIACHVPNDVNISKFARHANINTSDGNNNVTNNDCWTCHYQKDMNRSHVYLCDSCHKNSSGIVRVNDSALLVGNLQHGSNKCKDCHAPDTYHVQGTAGPRGRIENPGWSLISNFIYAGCHDCHRTHNGLDEPFHGPGIEPRVINAQGAIVPGFNHNAGNVNNLKNSSECSSSCHFTTVHNVRRMADSFKPKLENLSLSPSTITANSPVDITANGSSMSGSTSLQIEAAQYQVKNSIGSLMIDWTAMNALDGSFNSGIETVNATINTTGLPEGVYNVSVRVMASAPKTNISPPYYPLNGDWSIPKYATLVIELPKGFINGTVRNGNGEGVSGATVTANTGDSAITDSTGFYSLRLANGTYTLTAIREPEYNVNNTIPQVTVTAPDTVVQDIIMIKKLTGTISGVVTNV